MWLFNIPECKVVKYQQYLSSENISSLCDMNGSRSALLGALLKAVFTDNELKTSTIAGANNWKKLDGTKVAWAKKVLFLMKPLAQNEHDYQKSWKQAAQLADQQIRSRMNRAKKCSSLDNEPLNASNANNE